MSEEIHAPVVIWRRGDYRIVAREDVCDGLLTPYLVTEMRDTDALGDEAWTTLFDDPEKVPGIDDGLNVLALEIASRIDVMPAWVRAFVREEVVRIDTVEKGGGAA